MAPAARRRARAPDPRTRPASTHRRRAARPARAAAAARNDAGLALRAARSTALRSDWDRRPPAVPDGLLPRAALATRPVPQRWAANRCRRAPQRVRPAVEHPGGQQRRHVLRIDRPVGHRSGPGLDLDQRLEPADASTAGADEFDLVPGGLRPGDQRGRGLVGPQRERGGVARDPHHPLHESASSLASNASNRSAVTRPCRSSSTRSDGAVAQLPRQYTGSSV